MTEPGTRRGFLVGALALMAAPMVAVRHHESPAWLEYLHDL